MLKILLDLKTFADEYRIERFLANILENNNASCAADNWDKTASTF